MNKIGNINLDQYIGCDYYEVLKLFPDKINEITVRINKHEVRLARLEKVVEELNEKLCEELRDEL